MQQLPPEQALRKCEDWNWYTACKIHIKMLYYLKQIIIFSTLLRLLIIWNVSKKVAMYQEHILSSVQFHILYSQLVLFVPIVILHSLPPLFPSFLPLPSDFSCSSFSTHKNIQTQIQCQLLQKNTAFLILCFNHYLYPIHDTHCQLLCCSLLQLMQSKRNKITWSSMTEYVSVLFSGVAWPGHPGL